MLKSFFVTFGYDPMTDMTQGREYLVTFNGADLQGYRGHDDIGDSFTMSANLFEPPPPDTSWDDAIDAIFDADNSMADMPAPPGGGHNPTASDILGNAAPTAPCDDDMYTPEQEEEIGLWTEDGDPMTVGPASTEELREYRFKPNLY